MSSGSGKPRETAEVEKWIIEAQEGDQEALGRLLQMCRRYLLLVANKELTPALRAKVAPSDVVQDTLLEAGRDYPRFHGGSEEELLAWLRGILRNKVANVHRHFDTEKRQMGREVNWEDSAAGPSLRYIASPSETPSRHAQIREQDEQLDRAMQQLPAHYRQVLLLHTTEDLTFAQIAKALDSTADAVRMMWGRAVEELAKHLNAHP